VIAADFRPLHFRLQLNEARLTDPFVGGAEFIIIARGIAFALNIRAVEFGEFSLACRAMVVIPSGAPARITAEF